MRVVCRPFAQSGAGPGTMRLMCSKASKMPMASMHGSLAEGRRKGDAKRRAADRCGWRTLRRATNLSLLSVSIAVILNNNIMYNTAAMISARAASPPVNRNPPPLSAAVKPPRRLDTASHGSLARRGSSRLSMTSPSTVHLESPLTTGHGPAETSATTRTPSFLHHAHTQKCARSR
jgi:hypothetical protein